MKHLLILVTYKVKSGMRDAFLKTMSVLLTYNPVSKVAIFGFVNPLCSVMLSALVLGEVRQAFNLGSLIALVLVCVGIYVVNCKKAK